MKFEFEYQVTGSVTMEGETKEEAQDKAEMELDWDVDQLPGASDWFIIGVQEV